MAKNTICLWYDKDAEAAARFYAETFPDSAVGAVHRAPATIPSGKEGDVLTVEFTVLGIPCLGLNGGPTFKHSEAFSFQVATDDQAETDRYWNAIVGNGGQESACGWCKDKWGISWQITPRVLTEAMAAGGAEAKRAFEAMMKMRKIDVAAIEAARRRLTIHRWRRSHRISTEPRVGLRPSEVEADLELHLVALEILEVQAAVPGRQVGCDRRRRLLAGRERGGERIRGRV